ncbi:MAG: hypothetical protein K2K96_12260 [Lachnospiraceae bacterium]|nr:hypothetical protein [Lachnospiraceae bacterium]
MEDLHHNKIDDLDRRCSNDITILLKALSLFLPSDRQPELLLLVKFMEIQQLIQWMRTPHKRCDPMGIDDYEQVFAAIRPSLTEPTAQMIEQFINMASMFRMYQQMKDMMEVLGPLSADNIFQSCSDTADDGLNTTSDATDDNIQNSSGNGSMHSGGMNPGMMEMLKSMVPPENQAMVEMLMQMNTPS